MALLPPFRWSAHLWRISGGRASTQCQDPQAGVDVGRSLLKIGNGASRVRNTTPAPGPRPPPPEGGGGGGPQLAKERKRPTPRPKHTPAPCPPPPGPGERSSPRRD